MAEAFKLTYATMFNPPEELHTRFEEALVKTRAKLGKEYGMIINGQERFAEQKFEDRSPANTDVVLGVFQTLRMLWLQPARHFRNGAA
jgi:1-pyrroline-5-carboxylate dehydrogenase